MPVVPDSGETCICCEVNFPQLLLIPYKISLVSKLAATDGGLRKK